MRAILPRTPSITEPLQRQVENRAYDVYLCYHEADEAEVLQIGDKLKDAGVLPWLDTVDLQPGLPVRMQQEELIETIPAPAVRVGKQAIEQGGCRRFLRSSISLCSGVCR